MADYKTFLATSILTEDKVVTYRLLSRSLKIHVNDAKEMLYEFHRQQNAKKPDTLHATYLISGTKRKETIATNGAAKKDGEDDYMQSSPFMASSMPAAENTGESGVLSLTLAKEENLDEVRSQYEYISSIHIYSVGPHPLKDLQVLSDITREIQVLCASEDAVEQAPKYGTITNKNVKRRPARRPLHVATTPAPAPATAAVNVRPADVKDSKPAVKQESKPSQPSTANDFFGKGKTKPKAARSSNNSSKESTPNPPTLKRDSSSIFKSFAKAKPKLKREGTDSSAIESPALSAAEDSPMKDVVSDDDEEEEDTFVAPPPSKEIVDSDRRSRKEREAALKKMMDDDDEDEAVNPQPKRKEREDVEVEDEEEEERAKSVEKGEVPIVVSGGRRRGRRRVMKKKTVKDDEGYLVTKEEPVWESFSEDEPVEKAKPKAHASNTSTKAKKPAAKAGQGNIMSFFGKK
ncbi:hypothetical protein ONS95_011023 [Cadophora gregata]|uniref:uncharacterized protein n=1 Tax=Cadophora gregata TaxID=51156 RepID=UPI0026DD00A4|nr:uncharacterized protein ONS95_011023 [Cadophora gregata]KAK0119583.1 hypothetical protein ONS95_011023 [Cadophora gregata]KAK0120619.1 hypothetical protein ONS96_010823 [Cadophora gregata f. sp. sojae]